MSESLEPRGNHETQSLLPSSKDDVLHSTTHTSPTTHSLPPFWHIRASKYFILVTICVAFYTEASLYALIIPILPFILKERYHVSDGTEQVWISTMFAVFGATSFVVSPICGYIADRTTSRRLPLLISLPITLTSVILLGTGTSIYVILISRILAGMAAAITWPVGLALVVDTVGQENVGQWMGTAFTVNNIGFVLSPFLGGLIYASGGLWGVISVMLVLLVINFVLIGGIVEKKGMVQLVQESSPSRLSNEPGTSTIETRVAPSRPMESTIEQVGDAEADLKAKRPQSKIPPMLRLLASPRILTCIYSVFMQIGVLVSFDVLLPIFVKEQFGWDSKGAGLIFLNISLPQLVGPLVGKLSDLYGPKWVAIVGCVLTVPPLVLLRTVMDMQHNSGQVVALCACLVFIAAFLTFLVSPLAADLSFTVDQMEAAQPGIFGTSSAYAQVYSLMISSTSASMVVGPIITAAVEQRFGLRTVFWVLAVWCASASVPIALFIGRKGPQRPEITSGNRDEEQ